MKIMVFIKEYNSRLPPMLIISLILTFLIGRDILLLPGYIVSLEQFEVYTLQNFIKYTYPIWNEQIQAFNLDGAPKLYIYGFAYLLVKLLGSSYKVLQILLLLLPYPIAFFSMHKLSEHVISKSLKRDPVSFIYLFALIAAFVYTINPWIANNPRIIVFRFEYAFLPLIILLFILIIENDQSLKYGIFFAFTLAFTGNYRYLVIAGPTILLIFIIFNSLEEDRNWAFVNNTKKVILSVIIFLLISAGLLLSPILYTKNATLTVIEEFSFDKVNREELLHIFSTKIYDWPASNIDTCYQDGSHFLFILVAIFSFIYLLLIRKNDKQGLRFFYIIIFPLIFVFFVLFSAKEINFNPLILNLPFSDFIGRLLRHARWNVMPIVLSISVMVGLSLSYLYIYLNKNSRFITAILSIAIILLSSFSAWPMFTGDMNGYWRPSVIPSDYIRVNQIIEDDEGDFHVLWFPGIGLRKAIWSNATGISEVTAPIGLFPTISSSKPSYNTKKDIRSRVPFFAFFSPLRTNNETFNLYDGESLSSIYLPLNVNYLVICSDVNWTEREKDQGLTNENMKSVAERLNKSESVNVVYDGGYLTAFKLNNCEKEVFSIRMPLSIFGGLNAYGSLNFPEIITEDYAAIFLDQNFNKILLINQSSLLLVEGNSFVPSILLNYADKLKIISAPKKSIEEAPENAWAYSSGISEQSFQQNLDIFNIKSLSWDFDYDSGLAFTSLPSLLESPPAMKEEDLLTEWDFEDGLGEWGLDNIKGQRTLLGSLVHSGKHSLEVDLNKSNQSQMRVSSPMIPVLYGGQYRWEFYTKGENLREVNTWISEHDEHGNRLRAYHMNEIRAGDLNWKKVSFDYTVKFKDTEYIRLNLICGSNDDKLFQNRVWVDDVRIYDLSDYLRPNTLEIPFNVDKNDSYKLFIRNFNNLAGGELNVCLDDKCMPINTEDQLNKFVWKDIGEYSLEEGEHKLLLENVRGFNAVNLFVLVPLEEYKNVTEELPEILQNKTLSYLFEAESDLYVKNGYVLSMGGDASNGEAIELTDGSARQEIEVVKDGTYRLAIRAMGDFRVQVGSKVFDIHNRNFNYWYSPVFELKSGVYNLTIKSLRTQELDSSIANFSFESPLDMKSGIIWRLPQGNVSLYNKNPSGNTALEVASNASEEGWIWVSTPEINVTPKEQYSAITHMRYKNVEDSYISIEGYNETSGTWTELVQIPSEQIGTSDWNEYKEVFTIPDNVTMIRFILHGGWTINPGEGEATTWFDDIRVTPSKDYLDLIWLYQARENETLNDLFEVNEAPASIVSYTKIDTTRYEVRANATKPFLLSFAEGYDPLWEARIYKDGENAGAVKSIPLYSIINGFWIDETGDLEIKIVYKPQEWLEFGLWISGITFLGCLAYLFYDWRREKSLS